MEQHEPEMPVRIVGLMLPWSEVLFLAIQITVIQAVIGVGAFIILNVLGVL